MKARRRVLLSATLETPNGELEVRLRNLSGTGALIETSRPPEVGTLVTLRRGKTIAPGTVRWATSRSIADPRKRSARPYRPAGRRLLTAIPPRC
jgi:hypothetical protein